MLHSYITGWEVVGTTHSCYCQGFPLLFHIRQTDVSNNFASFLIAKGSFTLSVSINGAMSLAIFPWLNCLDFLTNQVSFSKNGLQPQLIRYDTSSDAEAPNQSLTRLV